MKVEVSRIKRTGVKVSVTLARAKRGGSCINIPVRAVAKDEIAPEAEPAEITIGFADTSGEDADDAAVACDVLSGEESAEDVCDESVCEEDSAEDAADELPEDDPDEEALLALIAEEEAEMALHMQQQEAAAQHIAAEAADEPEESEESSDSEQSAQVSQYMRYFDRRTDGEKIEVADERASGQEIICVDEESGRLSRVCGFIRNNQSAQPSDNEPDNGQTDIQE